MDPAVASIVVASIATAGTIAVAFINAMKDVDRAVTRAVAPLNDLITRLKAQVRSLGGDPDDA
ncbi:MAG: hypothetical protein EOP24_32150 [Hyphomicrobiales bacterium]|nr:MAG: hypothetical protein EOP24_32150 [Hyphomicrobiales bacterium]